MCLDLTTIQSQLYFSTKILRQVTQTEFEMLSKLFKPKRNQKDETSCIGLEDFPEGIISGNIIQFLDQAECGIASQACSLMCKNVEVFNEKYRTKAMVKVKSYDGGKVDINHNLRLLKKACPNLEILYYGTGGFDLVKETAEALAAFQDLQEIRYCLELSNFIRPYAGTFSLEPIITSCPKLISLDADDRFGRNTPDLMRLVAVNLPNLKSLNICNSVSEYISNGDIIASAAGLSKLTQLKVSTYQHADFQRGRHLSDEAVIAIAENCPNLTLLRIGLWTAENALTNRSLKAIGYNCPDLVHLKIKSHTISDEGLVTIFYKCAKLEHIDLSGSPKLTDKAVIAMAEKCANLTHVDLSKCRRLTDRAITLLAAKCPKLTHIVLEGCNMLTCKSVTALASHCLNLTHVDLQHCKLVTSEAVIALSSNCPNLTHLNLLGCEEMTDDVVKSLAYNNTMLEYLCLNFCPMISDHSVDSVTFGCPNLVEVHFRQCRLITESAATRMVNTLQHLRYVDVRFSQVPESVFTSYNNQIIKPRISEWIKSFNKLKGSAVE